MKLSRASICWLILIFFILAGGLWAAGCDSRRAEADGEKPVVVINQLRLTKSDLQEELKTRLLMPYSSESKDEKEPAWLDQLIDRELLVQEAQRLGLDREQDFMRTIEHFWKQALIKQLINHKGREINAGLHIYEPQIEAYYKKMAQEKGSAIEPLSVLRKEIIRMLQEETADKAMEDWITDLRKRAQISVDHEAVEKLEHS